MTAVIWQESNTAGDRAAVLYNKGLNRYAVSVTDAGREFVVPLKEEQIVRMILSTVDFLFDRNMPKDERDRSVKDLSHYGKVDE